MSIVKSINVNGQKFDFGGGSDSLDTTIDSSVDFAVQDDNGNKILALYKGHIITKNFDSRVISASDFEQLKPILTKIETILRQSVFVEDEENNLNSLLELIENM